MCGRYTLATPADEIVETFDVGPLTFDYFARFNIAPGQSAPVVAQDGRGRRAGLLTWGLIPGWRDEPGKGLFNARSESVHEKPSFREAFERRRCLVPADGFYEWSTGSVGGGEAAGAGGRVGGGVEGEYLGAADALAGEGAQARRRAGEARRKRPWWIHPAAGGLVAFAGLWERWRRPGAEERTTFTILTTEANEDIRPLHDRMPVVVDPAQFDAWLARETSQAELRSLLHPAPAGTFAAHAVGTRVNRAGEEGPELRLPESSEG